MKTVEKNGDLRLDWAKFEFASDRVEVVLRQWVDASQALALTLDRYGGVSGNLVFSGQSRVEAPVHGSALEVRDVSECIELLQVNQPTEAAQ